MSRVLALIVGVLLLGVSLAEAQLIPYPSTSPLYSQPSTADPGELRLPEAAANGTNYTAIKAPTSITANVTFTWPGSLPTSTGCFTSDTAGILTIEECNFSLSATHDWTGATTYTTSGGLGLKPHGTLTGNTTELRLLELAANGTNYVGLKGPDSIAANVIWTLPSADSSGCLQSNGSGVFSLAVCSPSGASYLVLGAHADLSAERTLTAGTGISFTDAGANSTLTVTNTGVTTLTGTANQVSVSASTGAVTLSTPQDIGTGSSPAFTNVTLTTALNIKSSTNQIVLDSDAAVNTGTITMASLNAARVWTFPNVTGTVVTTGDSGTVTNTMLAGSIAASKLVGTDITTVGTITSGVWTGTVIADSSLASALTGKTYASASQAAFTLNPYGAAAGNTGEIRLLELAANGTSYVGLKASDSLAGNVIWTLPIADSSGSQCLASNGSGVLSWTACSGGGVALGDSPTWTGQHTFSYAGDAITVSGAASRLKLTAVAGMIFVGTSTDRGWVVPGFQIGAGFGLSGSTGATGGVNTIGTNFYDTGGGVIKRLQATDGVVVMKFDQDPTASLIRVLSSAAGAQDSTITLTELARFTQGGGLIVGAPTGGDKGAGTINATAVYDDNTLLTDHVFGHKVDRVVTPSDDLAIRAWQEKFDTAWLIPRSLATYWRTYRRLPEMPTKRGEKSTGAILNALTMNVELLAVHVEELLDRLETLERR